MNLFFKKILIGVFAFIMQFPQDNEWGVEAVRDEEGMQLLFRQRSQSDWKDVWHTETHFRCRDDLVTHLYWACNNDIYRNDNLVTKRIDPNRLIIPNWLKPELAQTLLRTVRSHQSSITNECCVNGCTWEEYAEYCPNNKRRYHFSPDMKLKNTKECI